MHWVSAAHAVPAEVRLYDRLFTAPTRATTATSRRPQPRLARDLAGVPAGARAGGHRARRGRAVRAAGLLRRRPRFDGPERPSSTAPWPCATPGPGSRPKSDRPAVAGAPVELDHVFVMVRPGAPEAEAAALARAGLCESFRRDHPGQGTTNLCCCFDNAYLELLWLNNPAEALAPPAARLQLADARRLAAHRGVAVRHRPARRSRCGLAIRDLGLRGAVPAGRRHDPCGDRQRRSTPAPTVPLARRPEAGSLDRRPRWRAPDLRSGSPRSRSCSSTCRRGSVRASRWNAFRKPASCRSAARRRTAWS